MAQVSSIYNKQFLQNQNFRQKFHILLILTGKNASKWLEWYIFRVWGACQIQWHRFQVLYNKQFLQNQNFRQKFHILLILTGKNASEWLEWCIFRVWTCQIQSLVLVSMISDPEKSNRRPMAQNGFKSLGYNKFQFLKNQKISGKVLTFCCILTVGNMHHNGKNLILWHIFEWHVFRVWGVPNPMAQVFKCLQ